MKRLWTVEELVVQWPMSSADRELLYRKESTGRLGHVAQLAFFRLYAHFPEHRSEFAPAIIDHLAEQIGVLPSTLDGYEWGDRTGRRHREAILEYLHVGPFDLVAEMEFRSWLMTEALPHEPNGDTLEEWITAWMLRSRVVRPGDYNCDRILRGARSDHDDGAFRAVLGRLDPEMLARLKALVVDGDGGPPLAPLRADPGRVGLESLLAEIEKLKQLRALGLPADILKPFSRALVKRFRRRSAAESTWDLHRHPDEVGVPLLVFYCVPREAQIVDGLVELLMQITRKMSSKAQRRVEKEVVAEFRRVRGKEGLLYRIAEAASEQPDGIVREVIFPVAGEETLANLVKEARASGGPFRRKVHTVMRASYGSHYRR